MAGTTVSVIIPVYNLADYLGECVASVINQTLTPFEILIVDNRSTDDSYEIARALEAKHSGLISVLSEEQAGAPAARNLGLSKARGEWIQFLDGDDLLLPSKIEVQLALTDHTVGIVCGATLEQDQDGGERTIALSPTVWEGLFYGGGKLGFTSSNLWSREALVAVGGWKEELKSSQEYDLMFRMVQQGYAIGLSRDILTIKRDREGQISATPYGPRLYNYLKLRHRMYMYLRAQDLLTPELGVDFIRHYMSRYTLLRGFGPRHAMRFRKNEFRQFRQLPEFRAHPERRQLMTRSHIHALVTRLHDLVKLRWKKYLSPPE